MYEANFLNGGMREVVCSQHANMVSIWEPLLRQGPASARQALPALLEGPGGADEARARLGDLLPEVLDLRPKESLLCDLRSELRDLRLELSHLPAGPRRPAAAA